MTQSTRPSASQTGAAISQRPDFRPEVLSAAIRVAGVVYAIVYALGCSTGARGPASEQDAVASAGASAQRQPGASGGSLGCPDCCADGFVREQERGEATLVALVRPSASYVAVCPDGDLYLTRDGIDDIYRIPQVGEPGPFVSLAGMYPGGMACDEQQRFFVATFGLRPELNIFDRAGLVLVENSESRPRMLPPPIGGEKLVTPNGVTLGPHSDLYFTDTAGEMVVLVRETAPGTFESRVVASGVPGAVGVAYDPMAQRLYVGQATPGGKIVSFAVGDDGSLSDRQVAWSTSEGVLPAAMAIDEHGRVYVSDYFHGPVVSFPGGNTVATVPQPSGLAFRGGKLLVTDYYIAEPALEGGLYEVPLGVCGADIRAARR